MICPAATLGYGENPLVVNGVIDLREWAFAEDGIVQLDGNWAFSQNKFLNPTALNYLPAGQSQFIKVPDAWNGILSEDLMPGSDGFATYYLKVLCQPQSEPLGVFLLPGVPAGPG